MRDGWGGGVGKNPDSLLMLNLLEIKERRKTNSHPMQLCFRFPPRGASAFVFPDIKCCSTCGEWRGGM